MFKKSLSPEEITNYPVKKYEGEIVLIDKEQYIPHAIKEIAKENIIGLDTETRPSFVKGNVYKTSLVQIATAEKVYLFRLNKIGFPIGLAKVFESTKVSKIGIALHQDLKEIRSQFTHFSPKEIIDLNTFCSNLGFESIGAKKLSMLVLGFNISKRQQTSNWDAHDLTEAQISYAATDAWICREIYLTLLNANKI